MVLYGAEMGCDPQIVSYVMMVGTHQMMWMVAAGSYCWCAVQKYIIWYNLVSYQSFDRMLRKPDKMDK